MLNLPVEKLLDAIEIIGNKGGAVEPILSLAYHSDKVKPGALFVCIRGYQTDGHLFLEKAIQKGAVAAIVESFQEQIPVPQYLVRDSRLALAALADSYYSHPSRQIQLTGVTATNGKTSTTYMINKIFEEHGLHTGLIGTVIVKTGNRIRAAELTTPESLDLQGYFNEMVEEKVSHAVMEVSSSGLELNRVASVDFNTVVINNISREHIDLHGSFEAYYKAKSRLVREARPDQWAVLNMDCPYTAALKSETGAKVFTYGLKNDSADCLVCNLDLKSGRARFSVELTPAAPEKVLATQPRTFQIELSVLGLHSVYNAMAATLVALVHDIPAATIQKALYSFRGVERRFELIFEDNFKVIDDHFANSGNIDVTLETLQMMDYKKLHLVYAIRGSRGVTVNRENAEAIVRWADKLGLDQVIATTSTDYVGPKDTVTNEELQVYKNVLHDSGLQTDIYPTLEEAISRGISAAGTDDLVLLAGCQGMDYGAKVCLKQIHKLRPDLPAEKIFFALQNRVAGI
ncbi:MAG: UDP-N-acetylmuramyl-tripeptide synthetase [Firmicutes bacterium]|nr:UDP-N-acetylmuramyl-tripeptide synthetase [Bacillota bacterium]